MELPKSVVIEGGAEKWKKFCEKKERDERKFAKIKKMEIKYCLERTEYIEEEITLQIEDKYNCFLGDSITSFGIFKNISGDISFVTISKYNGTLDCRKVCKEYSGMESYIRQEFDRYCKNRTGIKIIKKEEFLSELKWYQDTIGV